MFELDLESESDAYLKIDDLIIDFDTDYDSKLHITEDPSSLNYDLDYIEPSNCSESSDIVDDPDIVDFLQDIASEQLETRDNDTTVPIPATVSPPIFRVPRPVQGYHLSGSVDSGKGSVPVTITAPSSPSFTCAIPSLRPDSISSGKYHSWCQYQVSPSPHRISAVNTPLSRSSSPPNAVSPPYAEVHKVHKPISVSSVLDDSGPEELTDAASKAARKNRIIIQREKRLRHAADAAVKAIEEQGISGVVDSTGAVVAIMENLASDFTGQPDIKMDVPPVPTFTLSSPPSDHCSSSPDLPTAVPLKGAFVPPKSVPPHHVMVSPPRLAPEYVQSVPSEAYPQKPKVMKAAKRVKESAASFCGVELPQGNDPDSKRQRRLIRNRLSAQLHRERKRDLIETLRDEVAEKVSEIERLKVHLEEAISINDNYSKAFVTMKQRFGEDQIKRILPYNIYSSLQSICEHLVSNQPGLVSIGSSIGSDSESDDLLTPPTSPLSGDSSISSLGSSTNKKRKRLLPKPSMAALGTMALCLMMGASIISPSPSTTPTFSSDGIDPHRRLSPNEGSEDDFSIEIKDMETDDELFTEAATFTRSSCPKCFQPSVPEWKISPLELYPDRWNLRKGAPWSHERSYEMFNSSTVLENIYESETEETTSVPIRIPPVSSQPGVRGGVKGASEISLVQYKGGTDAFGKSFMFCPKAHLNLAPGLHELVKWKIMSKKESRENNSIIQVNEAEKVISESRALIPKFIADLQAGSPSNTKGALLGGDDPYMSILVPASSVTGMGLPDLGYENKDAWLEIGCQVTSLKLLRGVAFNFDSEADIL